MQNVTITISTQPAEINPANTFNFNGNAIRIITIDNEPWFAVADVCDVLGYANSRKALADHCRTSGVTKRDISSGGQMRAITFINEGNLYRLIIKSRKPEAEKFESWVCDEVLPSIRKTGSYISAPMTAPQTISTKQYQELEHIVDIMANVMNALPQAKKHLWNIIRFETNVENVGKLPVSEYHRAKALLTDMHEQVFHDLKPFLQSIVSDYLRNHLGRGIPSTSELKKQWYSEYQTGLPQPLNWKEVTKQLETHQ
ncbi:Prophage antirepressor [Thiothrix eikelboomii]|uniref:Prophage antirepressor n=1 Tax=Thiothrix eikelboomii TaxID=92487 RepID=A0A1T4W4S8_9GAMM|nr:Bro-N domain-containing protein [Thiothrix eikelboomii]SKA72270.1 Prophage antirepressor [Thiothrix eikelboomii]